MFEAAYANMEIIKEEVDAWKTYRNNKNSKINWQFTNKEARVKLKRLYPSIHNYAYNPSKIVLDIGKKVLTTALNTGL